MIFLFSLKKNHYIRYKRIGYNLNVMRQSACLVFNPIMVDITMLSSMLSDSMKLDFRIYKKKRKYTIHVAKTKALTSFAVITVFGFAYADCLFSHETAHLKKSKYFLYQFLLPIN